MEMCSLFKLPDIKGTIWLVLLVAVMAGHDNHLQDCNVYKHPCSVIPQYSCQMTSSSKEIVLNKIKQADIKSLTIYLRRDLIYISLAQQAFSPNLEYLSILASCPFHIASNTFEGLKNLHNLTLKYESDINNQAHMNQTIIAKSSPSFAPGWLNQLSGLTHLNLLIPSTISFPAMQFCHLRHLLSLYLQNMNINTTSGLGITCDTSQEDCICLPELTYLNIMLNPIKRLNVDFSKDLPNLRTLDVRFCSLSSFNLEDICRYSLNIQEIFLDGNKLTVIQDLTHCDCPRLDTLWIQKNQLQRLPPGLFLCTRHLTNLTLAGNFLNRDTLMKAGLNTLSELVMLDLSHNNIVTLHPSLIGSMAALREFVCCGCGLISIHNYTFNQMKNLTILQLDRNELHTLPSRAFQSLVNLESLDLSSNYLRSTAFLYALPSLRELYLRSNMLTELPDFSESWLMLTTLILESNNISDIKPLQLSGLTNLRQLSLAFNQIKYVPDYTFDIASDLEELHMNGNRITYFGTNKLPRLKHLKLDNNFINKVISFEAFYMGNLQTLNLSRNSIESVYFKYMNHQLNIIDLSWNIIRFHEFNFRFRDVFSNLKVVNLTHNKLHVLEKDVFSTSSPGRPLFYLQGNPVHCDCHSEWLFYTKGSNVADGSGPYLPQIPDLEVLQCADTASGGNISFSSLTPDDLVCQYNDSCFPECICFYNDLGNSNIINCSSRGVTVLPLSGPMEARRLIIDNNNLTSLSASSLNFPLLESLSAYNNHISIIERGAFGELLMLRVLDLQQNDLQTIVTDTFSNLSSLEELYLNGNRINYIKNGSFAGLMYLKTLWLHGNNLTSLDFTLIKRMHSLRELTLHDNPWVCGCQFGPIFKRWVTHANIIMNASMIYCSDITPSYRMTPSIHNIGSAQNGTAIIKTLRHNQALLASNFANCSDQPSIQRIKYIKSITEVVSLATVTVILLIIILALYKTGLLLRVWFYNKFGVRFHEEEEDNDDKPYDVFIAYAKADERIVVREWLPELERAGMSYKVCLECRDWPPGATTTDIVVQSVQKSKRTIVLVSQNHLDTHWCEYSFDVAHYQVLTDKQIRLILVLTDIELEAQMTPAMKLYMKTNTYLVIGERWFWKKLRYFLADNPRGADPAFGRDFDLLNVY